MIDQPKPATGITKEWLLERAHLEEGCEIGAGCDKPTSGKHSMGEGADKSMRLRNAKRDQPASGEWTVEKERTSNGWYVCSGGEPEINWPFIEREAKAIAGAHNAALAAATASAITQLDQAYAKGAADERDKVQTLVDALKRIRDDKWIAAEASLHAADALAKVK